jgi:MFS transporter, Spinster family, sphingosine-1-phosphate transporter
MSEPKLRPYLALTLLTLLNFFNYVDRNILFGVQPLIKDEFHTSDAKLGLLTTAFFICYMVVSPFIGVLADRWSRKVIIVVGAMLWSAATLLTAITHNYTELLVRHTVVGIGEATFVVIAPAYIADLFSVERRGRMLAYFYLAIPVGSAVGYIIGGFLGTRYGWRAPFYVGAVPGILVGLAFLFTAEPERGSTEEIHRALEGPKVSAPARKRGSWIAKVVMPIVAFWRMLVGLAKNRAFLTATLGMAMFTFVVGGIQVWMPMFLARVHRVPLDDANLNLGAITVITGFSATLIGGWLGDQYLKRRASAYYVLSGASMLLAFPAALLAFYGPVSWMYAALYAAEFFLFLNTGPLNAAIVNSVSPEIRATAVGVNLFVIHILGDVPSPLLIGLISDHSSLRTGFSVALIAMLLSAAILFYGARFAPRIGSKEKAVLSGASA